MKDRLRAIAQKLRHPGNWTVLALVLGLFGLPAPVVALIGGALDLVPHAIDAAAALGAAAVAVALPDPAAPPG